MNKLLLIFIVLLVGVGGVVLHKVYTGKNNQIIGGIRFPTKEMVIYDANASTASGYKLGVAEYRNIICSVVGHSSPTATIKFAGSISENTPDFDVAQSVTNTWDYVEVVDTQNGATIDGDTGISFTGSNDVRLIEVNTNVLKWFTADVTSYSTGSTTVKCRPANNQ